MTKTRKQKEKIQDFFYITNSLGLPSKESLTNNYHYWVLKKTFERYEGKNTDIALYFYYLSKDIDNEDGEGRCCMCKDGADKQAEAEKDKVIL